jgi:hypothetical protein
MSIRNTALAAALAGALGLPTVASAITISGITIERGSIFELGELFEAENLAGTGNLNGFIDQVGEELIGIGRITSIRRADNSVLWQDGDNGRELTLHFYNYFAESITLFADPFGVPNVAITFSDGKVDVYSRPVGNFDPTGTQAVGIASVVSVPDLWLSLDGAPILGAAGANTGNPITLTSRAEGVDPSDPFASGNVFGQGRLDVTGGPAGLYLDTNQFECLTGQGAPNCPYSSDKAFSSEGGLQPIGSTEWAFSGNVTIRNFAVPEPATLGLLGLGLAGLGFASRRKAKAELTA